MKRLWICAAISGIRALGYRRLGERQRRSRRHQSGRLPGLPRRERQQRQPAVAEPRRDSGPTTSSSSCRIQDGKRKNPIMMPMASGLSPEDMADIAAYFDSQTNTGLRSRSGLLGGRREAVSRRRPEPRHPGMHGLPWPDRARQRAGEISAAARPAFRVRRATARRLCRPARGLPDRAASWRTIAKRLSADDMRNVASYVQGHALTHARATLVGFILGAALALVACGKQGTAGTNTALPASRHRRCAGKHAAAGAANKPARRRSPALKP